MGQWLAGTACEANMMQLLLAEPTREAAQQRHMLQALVSVHMLCWGSTRQSHPGHANSRMHSVMCADALQEETSNVLC
jgi:hypothetical protein